MQETNTQDEYNWPVYTSEYKNQINEMINNDNFDFFIDGLYQIDGDKIHFDGRLSGSWCNIYNNIWRLKPKTIIECGCGACYNLKNINTLLPDAEIHGCDLLESQINFGIEFSNLPQKIIDNLKVVDMSEDINTIYKDKAFEFVYTNAVLLHIRKEKAIKFMNNLDKLSSKYILMCEGYRPNMHGSTFLDLCKEVFGDRYQILLPEDRCNDDVVLIIK